MVGSRVKEMPQAPGGGAPGVQEKERPMTRLSTAFILALALAAAAARAQAPKNSREVLLNKWTEIGDKVVKMAEEFPENKYEFRATKEVRTFADVLRHVAFWNQFVAKT